MKKRGRKRSDDAKVLKAFRLTKKQVEFLAMQGDMSAFVRAAIDKEMSNERV